ncbi:hypothetical protein BDW59DRAFT_164493 [Aspergillus cavernicola]|uniref:Carrier domain-containing protein n=1 Tax=Aspergillus cavernicola TaxID=176166 RepID=A0ABR4I0G8_9EURO
MTNWRVTAAEHKLLPAIVDELAEREPESLWAEYPSSSTTFDDGFKQITYAQFANAALGKSDTGEPLAWLAPNDPRCSIALIAAIKAGFKLFLISERSNVAANHKHFDDVQCSTIVTTSLSFSPVEATRAKRELVDLSTSQKEDAFMVHTSGSTGFPKPASITHEFLTKAVRDIGISAPEGYVTQASIIADKHCPAGVNFGIILAFFTNTTVILPLPNVPSTGEALVDILAHIKADWAALAPLTLETISKNMSLLDTTGAKLDILVFSGGSLRRVFGDVISAKVKLLSFLGSSETGPLQAIYRHGYDFKSDWNYLQFPPEVGVSFDPCPARVYELVFNRTPETESYQAVFASYPDLSEFRTKDLFTKHPTIPALMFGQQRFEAGLLIELIDRSLLSASDRVRVIQRLWPAIQAANQILPAYAQVTEAHICFTEPGKPVLRTLKNTIRRQAILELYTDKINQVYSDVEEMWTSSSARYVMESLEAVQTLVREALQETKLGVIGMAEDFFQHGMDSLQVLRLVRHLRLKIALGSITPSLVYLNPSIRALSSGLYQLAHDNQISETQKQEVQLGIRAEVLQNEIKIPESIPPSLTTPAPAGYAESKYLAERILQHASQPLPLRTISILRLGQIALALSPGKWNPAGWVPTLIRRSREMGVIPDEIDGEGCVIDWVAVDRVAEVVVEVALDLDHELGLDTDTDTARLESDNPGLHVLHPLNPTKATWSTLLPSIITALEAHEPKKVIEIVSRGAWVEKLRVAAVRGSLDGDGAWDANLALKLVDFFTERFGNQASAPGLVFQTVEAERVSAVLRGAEGIDGGMMERWVGEWLGGKIDA